MNVRVYDETRLRELTAFLEARGCTVVQVDDATLDVTPEVAWPEAAELELDLYLRLWEVSEGVVAERVAD